MTPIKTPDAIRERLEAGAALAISISGGKDSQALLSAVLRARREYGWTGQVFAIHADLGRLEWNETPTFVRQLVADQDIELVIVRRVRGDLLARWQERMEKLAGTGKPFWSSSAARYCTSDMKRGPIDKHLRQFSNVVCAMGLRANESPARAKKAICGIRTQIDNSKRDAMDWNPIHQWTDADVWAEIGTSLEDLDRRRTLARLGLEQLALAGWPAHPAYVYGNERLSCALCVLACRGDLVNGARRHPALYQQLLGMEQESGFTFRTDLALADLLEDVAATQRALSA